MSVPAIKICGLGSEIDVDICNAMKVDFVGFVCYPASPRHVEISTYQQLAAKSLCPSVLVTVNADITIITNYITAYKCDYLQCHGQESPAYLTMLKEQYNVKIIKSIAIETAKDIHQISQYKQAADIILLDTKPTSTNELPGGNARKFDWNILAQNNHILPENWMLAGGININNVQQAIAMCSPPIIDISSGVESCTGTKDPALIEKLVTHVRTQ